MRIPPLYKRKTVQRFFAGIILGVLIGWFFFLLQYGQVYESLMFRITEQQATIEEQKMRIETLLSEQTKLNEQNQKKLIVQEIDIQFQNDRKLRINQLNLLELKKQALSELADIKNKDIETVANMKTLMKQTLENKVFHIGDHYYQLKIEETYLYTTLQIHVKIIPFSE